MVCAAAVFFGTASSSMKSEISRLEARLAAVRCGYHNRIGVDFGDTEVAAEVNQVKRTEFAGDLDNAHIAGRAREDGDASDVGTSKVQPEVGDCVVRLCGVGGGLIGVDEMLPAGGVVGVDDGIHRLRGVEGRAWIAVVVDGDASEGCGGAVGVHTVGLEEILGYLEHAAVKGEGSMGGGLVGEVHESALNVGGGPG